MLFKTPDSHSRSFLKAVSWRITGSVDTFVLGWLITGNAAFAGSIASAEVVTKIVLYYLHERAWAVAPSGTAAIPFWCEIKARLPNARNYLLWARFERA